MNAFSNATITPRPGNLYKASAAPKGNPMQLAINTAVKLTRSERPIISNRAGSNWKISCRAFAKACEKSFKK